MTLKEYNGRKKTLNKHINDAKSNFKSTKPSVVRKAKENIIKFQRLLNNLEEDFLTQKTIDQDYLSKFYANRIADMFGVNKIFFTEAELELRYKNKKKDASSRGLEFSLSYETFCIVMTQPSCFYTGLKYRVANEISLERVDSDKGYVEGNVVSCLGYINSSKSDLSVKEMEVLLQRVDSGKRLLFTTGLDVNTLRSVCNSTRDYLNKKDMFSFNPCI